MLWHDVSRGFEGVPQTVSTTPAHVATTIRLLHVLQHVTDDLNSLLYTPTSIGPDRRRPVNGSTATIITRA